MAATKEDGVDVATREPASTLLDKAKALAGIIRAEGANNDGAGRLSEATIAALRSGDFFGLQIPKCFGGAEAGPYEALQVIEAISEADGSTGWVLMACNVGTGSAAAYLPRAGAEAVFGNCRTIPIICGEGAPKGRAEKDGKGYRLTGRWSYGSGVLHAEYLHTGGMVYENGAPREALTFIVPARHARFLDNWDVVGLRGTASIDYALDNVYVPAECTHSPNLLVAEQGGNAYRLGIVGMSPLGHTGFALGLGRRVLDELKALAHAPDGRPSPLAELGGGESFHEGYGAAEAKYRAGRAFCYEVWGEVQATLDRGDPVSTRQFTLIRLSLNHVTTAVAEVCAFAHRYGGGVSIRRGILQRCVRDMLTATQHRIVSPYMLRECARELLGLAEGKVWVTRGLVDPA
jgi:alkylation response protein AidB-like acyl-CoA dehydrogenase